MSNIKKQKSTTSFFALVYNIPATVPGGIYSDLMNQNIIGDVFYGFNDNTTKWVGRSNWTYTLNFTGTVLDTRHNLQGFHDDPFKG